MAKKTKTGDVLGLRPYGEAAKIATKGTMAGASAFLSRICLPVAEELGLMFRDRVSAWRQQQAISILQKAEAKTTNVADGWPVYAHPRLVWTAVEQGSWTDNDELHEMWAGLLASSCLSDGASDENMIFMNLLALLTAREVRVICYAMEQGEKFLSDFGFLGVLPVILSKDEALTIFQTDDFHSADLQLDHLREIGLLHDGAGFRMNRPEAVLAPSGLCIAMYVRMQGYVGSPAKYFPDVKRESDFPPNYIQMQYARIS